MLGRELLPGAFALQTQPKLRRSTV